MGGGGSLPKLNIFEFENKIDRWMSHNIELGFWYMYKSTDITMCFTDTFDMSYRIIRLYVHSTDVSSVAFMIMPFRFYTITNRLIKSMRKCKHISSFRGLIYL